MIPSTDSSASAPPLEDWALHLLEELLEAAQFDRADLERIRAGCGWSTAALLDVPTVALTLAPFFLRPERAQCFGRCRDRLFQHMKRSGGGGAPTNAPRRLRKDGKFFYSVPRNKRPAPSAPTRYKAPASPEVSPPSSRQTSSASLSVFEIPPLATSAIGTGRGKASVHLFAMRQYDEEAATVMLPPESDLNEQPPDWALSLGPDNIAGLVLSTHDAVDFVCYADQMRKLLLLPMVTDHALSLRVYRVGQTLILEEVPPSEGLPTVKATHESALYSKFLYHSGGGPHGGGPRTGDEDNAVCSRTLLWSFKDVRVLLGVQATIFTDPQTHDDMFLKLKDQEEGAIPHEDLVNYWLENILSNVHTQRIGRHAGGFLRHYEQMTTGEIAERLGSVDIAAVEEQASHMLRWLQESCTLDMSVYNITFDPATPTEFHLYHAYTHTDRLSIDGGTAPPPAGAASSVFSSHVVGSVYYRDAERAFPAALADASADKIISTLNTYMNAIFYLGKVVEDTYRDQETLAHLKCAQLLLRLSGVHARNMNEESRTLLYDGRRGAGGKAPTVVVQETLRNAAQHLGQGLLLVRRSIGTRDSVLAAIHSSVQTLAGDFGAAVPLSVAESVLAILRSVEGTRPEGTDPSDGERAALAASLVAMYTLCIQHALEGVVSSAEGAEDHYGMSLQCIFRRRKETLTPGEDAALMRMLCTLQIAMAQRHMRHYRFTRAMMCLQSALTDTALGPGPLLDAVHAEIEAAYVLQGDRATEYSTKQHDLYASAVAAVPSPSPATLIRFARSLTSDFTTSSAVGQPYLQRALDALRRAGGDTSDVEYYLGVLCSRELEEGTVLPSAQITFTSGLTHLRRALQSACHQSVLMPRATGPVGRVLRIHAATARLYLSRPSPQLPQALAELSKAAPFFSSASVCPVDDSDAKELLRDVRDILKRALHTALVRSQRVGAPAGSESLTPTLKTLYADAMHCTTAAAFLQTLQPSNQ